MVRLVVFEMKRDASMSHWHQCATRCGRRAFLMGEGPNNRTEWNENRLKTCSTRPDRVEGRRRNALLIVSTLPVIVPFFVPHVARKLRILLEDRH